MDKLLNTIRQNEGIILTVLPILMAVIFAFFPVADVLGKTTANGVKLIFDGKGLGFARLCATIALLVPLAAAVLQFVRTGLPATAASNFSAIWPAASLVFAVLMAIAFPKGVALAWGGYLYCVLAIAGICIRFVPKR